jgi:hypothetical protein
MLYNLHYRISEENYQKKRDIKWEKTELHMNPKPIDKDAAAVHT